MKFYYYGNTDLQNPYYEGYTQQEEVTNLFVFSSFGKIVHAATNYTGSSHDTICRGISVLYLDKLSDEHIPRGMLVLGDA